MNSSELKGYLTGLILGDASIDKGTNKRSLVIKSIHKDFIDKIEEDLKSCTPFHITIKYNPSYIDKNKVNHKECWVLIIKAHPYFAKKYHHFYDDYRHRIATSEALNWLTPVGLANWYMSDGYICLVGKTKNHIVNRRVDICTDRYSIYTIQSMVNVLFTKFNIESSIVKRDKFYRIRIKQNSYQNFINIIKPYIVPSMLYKLYLGYEQQPKWMDNNTWELQKSLSSAITLTNNVEG